MLFVVYARRLFSRVLVITEISEMGLYKVPMFMSLLGFGMGYRFANFHVFRVMLLFNVMLYMLVRYASPSGLMCLGVSCTICHDLWSFFAVF